MRKVKNVFMLVALTALVLASAGNAAPITYMDVELHNGDFDANSSGFWSDPCAVPYEWEQVTPSPYTTAARWIQVGSTGEAINNTGELVQTGHAFTVQADLGGGDGVDATVRVYATENIDGTGDKVELVSVNRIGLITDDYDLFTVSNTGTGVPATLSGYYIQVSIGGPYVDHYISGSYDNIVVTSEVATTMTYMNETLHNGGFEADSSGFWYNTPSAVPYGWEQISNYPYTTASRYIEVGSTGEGVNNTGELVIPGHAYTVQADLGGGDGVDATVRVYATENLDGTGDRVELVNVNRIGLVSDGSTLFTVSNTGSGVSASLDGYYIQVSIGGPYVDHYISGDYDNIVVTSEVATTMTYMNADLNNGSLTAVSSGYWVSTPDSIPDGWVETNIYMYTAALLIQTGSLGEAVNNTGEQVPASHAFTVSADLGGADTTLATVRVYATENDDGTGTKVLLAQVTRPGDSADGWNLFTVSSTGSTSQPSVTGYYVQVVIGDLTGSSPGGYYDNIVLTSELSTGPVTITYMDATLNNGALDSEESSGYWTEDPVYVSYGWSADDPNRVWTATGFVLFDSLAGEVTSNTGITVPSDHQFTIAADLGGVTDATARASVYATENIDGTGTRVLLTEVSRPGNDANGYGLFNVSASGSTTDLSTDGYYVQVALNTIGDPNLNGYYDNIVVTSIDVIASKTYMDPNLHNGAMTATSSGFWTNADAVPSGGWSATDPNFAYTTSAMFSAIESSAGDVINNTQETVLPDHQFTVQADLGGVTGATAEIFVYATENWDGTGAKVLLTQVSRLGNDGDGFTLFPVSGTGSTIGQSLAGYYVQVVIKTTGGAGLNGYYDNIVVTSGVPTCGDPGHEYPIGDLSQDCYVNTEDLELFVDQWLATGCVAPDWCNGADLSDESNNVNLNDFAVLAENWADCTSPMSPCSYNP